MANPEITLNDGTPLSIGPAYKASGKTILGSQGTLPVGAVLGVVTATQKLKHCAIANGDGSEVARFILMKETDTSAGDVTDQDVLKAGTVNGNKLTFGGSDTIASVVAASGLSHDENLKANGIIAVLGSDIEAYDNT